MQRILARACKTHTNRGDQIWSSLWQYYFRQYHATTRYRNANSKSGPSKPKSEDLLAQLFPKEYAARDLKQREEQQRRLKQLKTSSILPRSQREKKEQKTELEIEPTKWDRKKQVGEKGILRFGHASKNLVAEDFLRLMPHSKNLEGWSLRLGAIEKVVPGRDLETLERQDFYYLVFESMRSAEEYRQRALRIAELYDIYGPFSQMSSRPMPRGLLLPGEDPMQLVKSYTLAPPGQPLDLNLMKPPYKATAASVSKQGGYAAIVGRPWKSPAEVILRAGEWTLSYGPLIDAIRAAERDRNMPWTGGSFDKVKLAIWSIPQKAGQAKNSATEVSPPPSADEAQEAEQELHSVEKLPPLPKPKTYIAGFETATDADAFARYFNRRHLPNKKADPSAPPLILDAEVLW